MQKSDRIQILRARLKRSPARQAQPKPAGVFRAEHPETATKSRQKDRRPRPAPEPWRSSVYGRSLHEEDRRKKWLAVPDVVREETLATEQPSGAEIHMAICREWFQAMNQPVSTCQQNRVA